MLTKMIAALTVTAALLGTGAFAMSSSHSNTPKKVGVVEVTELDFYVDGEEADCEIAVTPKNVTVVKGGDRC